MRYLSASQARQIVHQCSISPQRIFNELLKNVQIKIHILASLQQFDMLWECPMMLESLPVFDTMEYTNKIADHLQRYGYFVQYFKPNGLYISWRFKRSQRNQTVSSKKTKTPVVLTTKPRKKPWEQQCLKFWDPL